MPTVLLACLTVLLALGLAERVARDRALRDVPVRIHVNGTRAKSTVTRLIWSALREAGRPAIAKTTGTAARVLLPDGRERPVRRRGPVNVREQLALLRLARRAGARALVAECMALDPVLQHVTERQMIRATIGVITNVRLDHTEIMGTERESIAATLANSVPVRGVLVVGRSAFTPLFERRAAEVGTRVVVAGDAGRDAPAHDVERWLREDYAVALAVTRELGIDDETALRGFASAPPDPGAVRRGRTQLARGESQWMDATGANDPDSLDLLLAEFTAWRTPGETGGGRPRIMVYHHRDDRAPRLECFSRHSAALAGCDQIVVSGARPPRTLWRRLSAARPAGGLLFVAPRDLPRWLARRGPSVVVFCGNTRGLDVSRLLQEAATCG